MSILRVALLRLVGCSRRRPLFRLAIFAARGSRQSAASKTNGMRESVRSLVPTPYSSLLIYTYYSSRKAMLYIRRLRIFLAGYFIPVFRFGMVPLDMETTVGDKQNNNTIKNNIGKQHKTKQQHTTKQSNTNKPNNTKQKAGHAQSCTPS